MEAKLFIQYLPWLREPKYAIKNRGLNADKYYEMELRDTTPIKRSVPLEIMDFPLELHDLFGEYDMSPIYMLWTSFWEKPRRLIEGWGFADMSEVNIVLTPSGKIEAYNAYPIKEINGESQFLDCLADNLESYLGAMMYGQLNKSHFISGFPDEDPILYKKTELVARHCALIAGGDKYYEFWAGILGLPPDEEINED